MILLPLVLPVWLSPDAPPVLATTCPADCDDDTSDDDDDDDDDDNVYSASLDALHDMSGRCTTLPSSPTSCTIKSVFRCLMVARKPVVSVDDVVTRDVLLTLRSPPSDSCGLLPWFLYAFLIDKVVKYSVIPTDISEGV